jgi:predicted histidine transporter YuiF (NhaC family)
MPREQSPAETIPIITALTIPLSIPIGFWMAFLDNLQL